MGIDLQKDVEIFREVACRRDMASVHGSLGIAYLHGATHRKISRNNSSPDFSCDGHFAIVNNGIISNHPSGEISKGAATIFFFSDTDARLSFIDSKNCPRERVLLKKQWRKFWATWTGTSPLPCYLYTIRSESIVPNPRVCGVLALTSEAILSALM